MKIRSKTVRPRTEIEHQAAVSKIIKRHFESARGRVPHVSAKHFTSASEVLSRHFRNLSDVPNDFLSLLVPVWNYTAAKIVPSAKWSMNPSGKERDLELVVAQELLHLSKLEAKLDSYIKRHSGQLVDKMRSVFSGRSEKERQRILKLIKEEVIRLNAPSEAVREVIVVGLTIAGGVAATNKFSMSGIAIGQTVATSMYLGSASWYSAISAKIFGMPTIVTVLGGLGGFLSAAAIAPIVAPGAELVVNHFRAEQILLQIADRAESNALGKGPDCVDVASTIAKYLQFVPDVIDVLRKLKPA